MAPGTSEMCSTLEDFEPAQKSLTWINNRGKTLANSFESHKEKEF
jgi:hypothetical protein